MAEFLACASQPVEDLERFDREIKRTKQDQDEREEAKQEETVDTTENDATPVDEPGKELCIRCEPILDPLLGVATNELPIGSYVACRLAQDSVFYKLLAKNFPNTNDVVKGKVSGILMNDLGTDGKPLALRRGLRRDAALRQGTFEDGERPRGNVPERFTKTPSSDSEYFVEIRVCRRRSISFAGGHRRSVLCSL